MFASNTSQVANDAVFIEDTFACHLYTGNNSTLSITNGIDVSGKGGLVWIKNRQQAGYYHTLVDTVRGPSKQLYSNTTNAQSTATGLDVTAFTSTGFTLGPDNFCNQNNANNVSWTFRKQAKFFDVVTYTGDGGTQNIAHSLGSTPGCIIVKRTNTTGSWRVFHTSVSTQYGNLNSTAAFQTTSAENVWGNNSTTVAPTSTQFTVGNDSSVNASGSTYVAYLFAHNAGGFGATETDNVISCGSFTASGGTATVTLGYEPQWVMIKSTDATGSGWEITDNMRAMPVVGSSSAVLSANLSNAESSSIYGVHATATGFVSNGYTSGSFIYIAIRRGPMKVPTSGTSVFYPLARTGTGANANITGFGFPPDMAIGQWRNASNTIYLADRLRGISAYLPTNSTGAENTAYTNSITAFGQDGISVGPDGNIGDFNYTVSLINWNFRRAPSFFDEVCYTGTGTATTVAHNLGVVPELMIVKTRSLTGQDWAVYSATLGNTGLIYLNQAAAANTGYGHWNSTSPTSTVFSLGGGGYNMVNGSGATYVNYLFATCAGVSKVGSYTGTGTTKQIDCGFTGGARFVLIKRTDSTGDWYVWDSARGIVSGNDPYLLLNSTAAETTGTDYIDPYSAGFEISSTAPAAINASGGTFIFLAIA